MGTITERRRANGSIAYRVGIVIKQNGRIVHKEARIFDLRTTAKAWMERLEKELRTPGGLEEARTPQGTLGDFIDRYVRDNEAGIGRTKTQVLRLIKTFDIADMRCEDIRSGPCCRTSV